MATAELRVHCHQKEGHGEVARPLQDQEPGLHLERQSESGVRGIHDRMADRIQPARRTDDRSAPPTQGTVRKGCWQESGGRSLDGRVLMDANIHEPEVGAFSPGLNGDDVLTAL